MSTTEIGARPGEDRQTRVRRLRIRSWRRGIKEMDLILGGFADARLADLSEADLAAYDALLVENDQELYAWIAGRRAAPEAHRDIVAVIAAHAGS